MILCVSSLASAAIVAVPGDAPTIGAAIGLAQPGDTVEVAAGTYRERVDFAGKDVEVVALAGPGATEIDGEGGGTVVSVGPGGRISGFTITGGFATFGGGMSVWGEGARIDGNVFEGNVQTEGGSGAAIDVNGASPVIARNLFVGQSCDDQFLSGAISVLNGSAPLIVNNVFVDNDCRAINLVLPSDAAPRIVNNTILRNPAAIKATFFAGAVLVVRNNVITENAVGLECEPMFPIDAVTWQTNLVYGNAEDFQSTVNPSGTDGNVWADPGFVDSPGGDLRPAQGSPLVDVGNDNGAPLEDFDGAVRPFDGDGDGTAVTDIGAYELQEAPALATADAGPDVTVDGGATVTLHGEGSGEVFLWGQAAGEPVALDGDDTPTATFVAPDVAGVLTFALTVTDGAQQASDTVDVTVVVSEPPPDEQPPPTDDSDPEPSGCGCGSGVPGSGWLLALLLAGRRRRH